MEWVQLFVGPYNTIQRDSNFAPDDTVKLGLPLGSRREIVKMEKILLTQAIGGLCPQRRGLRNSLSQCNGYSFIFFFFSS